MAKDRRGRVYQTASSAGPIPGWRGVISEDGGRELWRGRPKATPDEAFQDLVANVDAHECTDFRPWGGTIDPPASEEE